MTTAPSGWRPGTRLALDWGQARIGVAACDPAGTLAYPVEAVPAGPAAIPRILALVAEYEPIELVVGLPRSLSGGEGPAAATVRTQVAELARAVGPLSVRLVDERLTTVTAAQRLRAGGRSAKQQRSRIDAAAAAAILEHALDSERHSGQPPGELLSIADAHD
ncbi:Holliday junction resolvase RuvX [Microlunatus aurantiacus]|uniref:Putative pre-16S rRNA nuclease n=1 Tax=Microlunatus aurantiacus TaxID=446786 RepID=A0ABP7E9E9_9ACTN